MSKRERIPEVRAEVVSDIPLTAAPARATTEGDSVTVEVPRDPVADVIVDTAAAAVVAAFDRFAGAR